MSLASNSLLIHFSMLLEMKTPHDILNHVSQLLGVNHPGSGSFYLLPFYKKLA